MLNRLCPDYLTSLATVTFGSTITCHLPKFSDL